MSKKLGLENKYNQFINPTQLGKYKAVMGKIKTESGKLKDLKSSSFVKRALTLRAGPTIKQAASSVLKRSPVGKVISAVGKAFTSKPGMFGAGVGIGSNVKKDNKKMGGGMMRYSNGSKGTVKLSARQKVIAAKAPPPNKIDGKDFAVLKAEKAKGRGQGLQDEKMKPGKIMKAKSGTHVMPNGKIMSGSSHKAYLKNKMMKADKGVFAEMEKPQTLLRDLPLKKERLRNMTPEKLNKMLKEYNKTNPNKVKAKFLKK